MKRDDEEREEREDEDEEENEEREDPEEETPASERQPRTDMNPRVIETKEEKPKRRRGRPSGRLGTIPSNVEREMEAHLVWLDVIRRMGEEGITLDKLIINVGRSAPGEYVTLGEIEASSVAGDGDDGQSGATQLRDAIIDQFHGPWAYSGDPRGQGPATYNVSFLFKRGHTIFDRGKLKLPAIGQINAMREAAMKRSLGQGMGGPPPQQPPQPQGVGSPPSYGPPQSPQWPTFGGYGPQPQQQPQSGESDVLRSLREENQRLAARVDQLVEVVMHQRGEPPPIQPPATAPAPRGPLTVEDIDALKRVAENLGLELLPKGARGVGAPPAVTQTAPGTPEKPKTRKEIIQEMVEELEEQDELKERVASLVGVKLPEEEPEKDEKEDDKEEGSKDEGLGFRVHPVPGAKWPNGDPVQSATDAKNNLHLPGLLLSNPFVMERFGGAILGIAEKLAPAIANAGKNDPAQKGQREEKREEPQREQAQQPNGSSREKTGWDV